MRFDPDTAVLAADGGGTTCRLALKSGDAVQAVTLGSANVSTDIARAAETIRAGLDQLAHEAGVDHATLCALPAYLGLAGVIGSEDAEGLAHRLPLRRVRIEDDRCAAVRGALGAGDGTIAGLGTGSFFGRQTDGAIRLVGGWGSRLGDEASGFWIGREALARTLDVTDGLRPQTGLSDAILTRFGGTPRGIVAFSIAATPGDIAALAPLVADTAANGDPLGIEILDAGVAYIRRILNAIGWRKGEPICLLGGATAAYRGRLPEEIVASVKPPRGSALDGALALAADFREEARP
ncbi:BadF/BadG/BcrA/BcrD ATPase family protein [Tropicimonas isoalkanivorans]|uniref:Glucosamine kinase n=1 Tax=Tropicimonas isoalkanivorans TaxID=441112 RepID=A0A1I1DCX4_9RHOB|nr:BadF/BadG/BcrA/BcrD ATPase family protein [Tropicimonas isoalkanivorans]SFB72697.1 glucosamine kinase [Tropicimonas isoalkanivorans]